MRLDVSAVDGCASGHRTGRCQRFDQMRPEKRKLAALFFREVCEIVRKSPFENGSM